MQSKPLSASHRAQRRFQRDERSLSSLQCGACHDGFHAPQVAPSNFANSAKQATNATSTYSLRPIFGTRSTARDGSSQGEFAHASSDHYCGTITRPPSEYCRQLRQTPRRNIPLDGSPVHVAALGAVGHRHRSARCASRHFRGMGRRARFTRMSISPPFWAGY